MVTTRVSSAFVPADKQLFTVSEASKLLAQARWPHAEDRRVSYPLRFDPGNARGAMLTDEDNAVLSNVCAKLKPPTFPMPESEWAKYQKAFERSKIKPAWQLGACVEDDALTFAMLRAAAEEKFMAGLIEAIRAGSISARDPLTHMPCTDVRALVGQSGLLLSRADVEKFAASAMIEVRTEPGEATARLRAERVEARCQELKAQGVANWQQTVAKEEGVSVSRIKQIRSASNAE